MSPLELLKTLPRKEETYSFGANKFRTEDI